MTTSPHSLAGPLEGEQRKLDAWRRYYIRRGRRALPQRLLAVSEATADDARAAVDSPPNVNPKLFGAVPGPRAGGGIIRPSGRIRKARPEAPARPVRLWQFTARAAAVARLEANPDLPEPPADADAPGPRSLFHDLP